MNGTDQIDRISLASHEKLSYYKYCYVCKYTDNKG